MVQVTKLDKKTPVSRKKVAAYCRVSTTQASQENSYSLQMAYYNNLIQSNPDWEFAGVFSDYGRTGTSIKKRAGFQAMMKACEEGKIDLILTKSIKRFARNTVDLLEAVRHLKNLGVEVFFDQENISTAASDGDFMLSILASFAQDESRSISDNVRWAYQKKFEKGEVDQKRDCYAYHNEGGCYQIIPDQAEIVKRIYREFLSGIGLMEITRKLNEEGIPTYGGSQWNVQTVRKVLQNFSYTGNVILQKYINLGPYQSVVNDGYADQYIVYDSHEAIVSLEDWELVQARFKKSGYRTENPEIEPFKGKVFCQQTGMQYWHDRGHWRRKDVIANRSKGKKVPAYTSIPTYALQEAAQQGHGEPLRIEVRPDGSLDLFFLDQAIYGFQWTPHKRTVPKETLAKLPKNSSTRSACMWKGKRGSFSCFAKCGTCGKNFISCQVKNGRRYRLKNCKHHPSFSEEEMQQAVRDVLNLENFSEAEMDKHLSHCVVDGDNVTFHFWDGRTERRTLNGQDRL